MTASIEAITDLLVESVTGSKGGSTINKFGAEVTRGIAVAISKDIECKIEGGHIFRPAVKSWVRRQIPLIEANDYFCFGAWREDGDYYFDVVDVLPDRQLTRALEVAKENDQIAIFHLSTQTCLRIE